MQIVTLTSDLGWKDPYIGMLKGSLLSEQASLVLVDLSHEVEAHNILQAAHIVRQSYKSFPERSIHLLAIHSIYAQQRRYLLALQQGHYFLAPDNGLFSLIFDEQPKHLYELPSPERTDPLEMRFVFARAVALIASQMPLSELGEATEIYRQGLSLQPLISKDQLRGTIIHIDSYGNAITNIDRTSFERIGKNRSFELHFKHGERLCEIHQNYEQVDIGDLLCLFNTSNLLEIAVYMGKAAELYSLSVDNTIYINFSSD